MRRLTISLSGATRTSRLRHCKLHSQLRNARLKGAVVACRSSASQSMHSSSCVSTPCTRAEKVRSSTNRMVVHSLTDSAVTVVLVGLLIGQSPSAHVSHSARMTYRDVYSATDNCDGNYGTERAFCTRAACAARSACLARVLFRAARPLAQIHHDSVVSVHSGRFRCSDRA